MFISFLAFVLVTNVDRIVPYFFPEELETLAGIISLLLSVGIGVVMGIVGLKARDKIKTKYNLYRKEK